MRIPKVVVFKVAFTSKLKSLFRSSEGYFEPGRISTMRFQPLTIFAKSSVVDVRLHSKYKFMSFIFEPHSLNLCLSLFEQCPIKSLSASWETIAHGINNFTELLYCVSIFFYLNLLLNTHQDQLLFNFCLNMMMLICIKQHLSNI